MEIEIVNTKHGKQKLLLEGYSYIFDKFSAQQRVNAKLASTPLQLMICDTNTIMAAMWPKPELQRTKTPGRRNKRTPISNT